MALAGYHFSGNILIMVMRVWIIGITIEGNYKPLLEKRSTANKEGQDYFEDYQDALDRCKVLQNIRYDEILLWSDRSKFK